MKNFRRKKVVAIHKFMRKLYCYQERLVAKCLDPSFIKGIMILPTASGKGVICREIIRRLIVSLFNIRNDFVGVVFTPRLLLNQQWIVDFIKCIEEMKRPVNFVLVSSARISMEDSNAIMEVLYKLRGAGIDKPVSTSSPKELKQTIENNRRNGINTIVISTYHSNAVVRAADVTFDYAIFDEAHFLPGRENPSGVKKKSDDLFYATKVKSKRKLFTTATPKIGNIEEDQPYYGRGLNSVEFYGEEIYGWVDDDGKERRITPRDLIEFGSILSPIVHVVADNINLFDFGSIGDINKIHPLKPLQEKEHEEVARITIESFFKHRKEIKRVSAEPDNIGAKTIVVCDGSTQLDGIMKSKYMKKFMMENPDVDVSFISSYTGIHFGDRKNANVSNSSKSKYLDHLNSLESKKDAIIFHIDILTCGLDISGITGVIFFKKSKLIKLLQNLGRAGRLHEVDRLRWERGEIKPGGSGYIKPNFYVILPVCHDEMADFVSLFARTINGIRDDYGFKSNEFVHIGGVREPAPNDKDDDNGIVVNLRSKMIDVDREYYQKIEEKKSKREARQRAIMEQKLEGLMENGDWSEARKLVNKKGANND